MHTVFIRCTLYNIVFIILYEYTTINDYIVYYYEPRVKTWRFFYVIHYTFSICFSSAFETSWDDNIRFCEKKIKYFFFFNSAYWRGIISRWVKEKFIYIYTYIFPKNVVARNIEYRNSIFYYSYERSNSII